MEKSPIVIFDIDGTLVVESSRLLAQTTAVSEHFGGTMAEMQATLYAFFAVNDFAAKEKPEIKNNIPVYMEMMGERLGRPVSPAAAVELAQLWTKAYLNSHSEPALFSDAIACLERLRAAGFRLVVASGNTVATRMAMLEKTGIAHFFSAVYAAIDVGFQKQDVRFWEVILAALDYQPGDSVVVVGNQLNDDIVNPLRLGLTAFLIDRPSELKKMAEEPVVEPTATFADLGTMLQHPIFNR
jgi:phosphoglycolate phosphatase-like HAD superfamily hydrolase